MKVLNSTAVKTVSKMFLPLLLGVMTSCSNCVSSDYIGASDIKIENGHMTPEALLAFGRISDPVLSPDGKYILYGISYNSIKEDKSCRNLWLSPAEGGEKIALTHDGDSFSNARWSVDGKSIYYIQKGQIFKADIKISASSAKLINIRQLTEVKNGVSEFKLSPKNDAICFVSEVDGYVKTPADSDPELDKADAFETEDLMYRHWDHWATGVPHTFFAHLDADKHDSIITTENSIDIVEDANRQVREDFAENPEIAERLCGTFELPTAPFSGLEDVSFSPDGKQVFYSCKREIGRRYAFSTDTEIYIWEPESSKTTVIDVKGGYDTCPVVSPDGKQVVWVSMERNGYEADKTRLLVADIVANEENNATSVKLDKEYPHGIPVASNIKNIRDITSDFKYNASAPVWSEDSQHIYFSALAEGIEGVFKADRNDSYKILRITGEDMWYDFKSPFAVVEKEEQTHLYSVYNSLRSPNEIADITIGGDSKESSLQPMSASEKLDPVNEHRIVTTLKADCPLIAEGVSYQQLTHENEHILKQLDACPTQARLVKTVDGKEMLTWVMYPPHFDPEKEYPSILITLGGPQGTISQGWSYRWCYRLMASQGYIVVMPNRRGTTAFGPEWTEQISGDYIGLNMQDYLKAAKDMKKEPYVGKMAACGASYGGYSVYYLSGIHGDVFDCFIAHAGIFNVEHMYMTTEEMWFPNWDNGGLHTAEIEDTPEMGPKGDGQTFGGIRQGGSPWSNAPKAVRQYKNSPHTLVKNWHTPILCIHGGKDFRVPYDEGMAAFNAARLMGVPAKLIVFPDENHWILRPQNAIYWHRQYFDWLDRWCK